MHERKYDTLKKGYQKTFKKLTWFFLCTMSFFIDKTMKNKRGPVANYQSLFGLKNILF